MSEKRTELSKLGEFGLIDRIKSKFTVSQPSTVLGIGDDAAIIAASDDLKLLSTDMLLEGVHFNLSYNLYHCFLFVTCIYVIVKLSAV